MRMIDADKLKAELFDADWLTDNDEHMVEEIVERQPTIDAVPVVRCKDCKWYDSVFFGCTKSRFYPDPDFFCACGERMDGGAET